MLQIKSGFLLKIGKNEIMKNFNIEISYQPINHQYLSLIKHGNTNIFQVDENLIVAIDKALKIFLPVDEVLKNKLVK